jgi:hypothetical protein
MKRSWPNLRYYSDICLEEMRKTTKAIRIVDFRAEFELRTSRIRAGMLTTRPLHSISYYRRKGIARDEHVPSFMNICQLIQNLKGVGWWQSVRISVHLFAVKASGLTFKWHKLYRSGVFNIFETWDHIHRFLSTSGQQSYKLGQFTETPGHYIKILLNLLKRHEILFKCY